MIAGLSPMPMWFCFAVAAILFSLFTVWVQVGALSLEYLTTEQFFVHRNILDGAAASPNQYRILSEYIVNGVIQALSTLGVPQAISAGFISFRLLQNLAIFLLVWRYFTKLGLDVYVTLLGMSILAWAMSRSLYDSNLSFNTYSDIIFYLGAALAILHDRPAWVIPIVGLAALNRETSGLIPLLLIAYSWATKSDPAGRKHDLMIAAIALALFAVIFLGLRYVYGVRAFLAPYGNQPGLEILKYNFFRPITWVELFGTLGIIPFLDILSFRRWPVGLRAFFWAMVPVWLVVHSFFAVLAETRLLLVPFVLVLLPGALFPLARHRNST